LREYVSPRVDQPALVPLRGDLAAGVSQGLTHDDLQRARASLARRVDDCSDRLDDVVSELVALHRVREDVIVRRVERMITAELAETG
jgi:hypothetical protein